MGFYTYVQNNSGGGYEGNYKFVIVEAKTAPGADEAAERSGYVYFDGVERGLDCDCCGNRWSRVWASERSLWPQIYGESVNRKEYQDQGVVIILSDGTELNEWQYGSEDDVLEEEDEETSS